MMLFAILLGLVCSCSAYTVKTPDISLLEPQGLEFAYPADNGVTMVSYHYNINKPLSGVASGQYNVDVNTPTNGYFVTQNTAVIVNPGDTVYYWINVLANGGGYSLTDQKWVASSPTTTTTTKATTTSTTTTAEPTAPVTSTTNSAVDTTADTTKSTPATSSTSAPSGGGSSGGGSGTVDACNQYPCSSSCDMNVAPCNGLIFEENWDTLDMTRWQHELTMSGGGNWEFEFYTNNRTNSYVRDNTLFIKPTLTADHYGESFLSSGTLDMWGSAPSNLCTANAFWGCQRTGTGSNYINPVQSARIRTVNSFSFKYGKVEVEAKMPAGDWLWPAIWLLPRDNAYGDWPASGEIDLIESRGNANLHDQSGVSKGNNNMGSTLHWGPYWPVNGYEKTTQEKVLQSGTYADSFHNYVVEWSSDNIKFTVDDDLILTVDPGSDGFWSYGDFDTSAPGSDNPWSGASSKMAPFDQEFYILINLAVGGTNGFFQDTWTNGGYAKPWSNTSPTAMRDFWMAKSNWYPTWQPDVNNGENAALQVKNIKVWAGN